MKLSLIARVGLLATIASAWTVDFHTEDDCGGDAKSTEGTDPACQEVADLSKSIRATFADGGFAGLYTDEDCTTGGEDGGDLDSGECYPVSTKYYGVSDTATHPSKKAKLAKMAKARMS